MWEKIKNLFNVRRLPHPERGNYLGASRRCHSENVEKAGELCPPPIDALDFVGVLHDYDTNRGRDPWADFKFAFRMLRINPFNRSNYDFTTKTEFLGREFNVDPRVYQYLSALVMGSLGFLTAPVRLVKNAWEDF